jgi:1-deoxy-D-xylulose-5-phosphate synthase
LVTVEENAVAGGAGSGVNEILSADGTAIQIQNIGIPDRYIDHGSRDFCLASAELDSDGLLKQINARLNQLQDAGLLDDKMLKEL